MINRVKQNLELFLIKDKASSEEQGFSLFEILVVLAIVSGILSIVSVNGIRMLERYKEQIEFRRIYSKLENLRYQAFIEQKNIELGEAQIGMEDGWKLTTDEPVYFLSTGVCTGGIVTIESANRKVEKLGLESPKCRI